MDMHILIQAHKEKDHSYPSPESQRAFRMEDLNARLEDLRFSPAAHGFDPQIRYSDEELLWAPCEDLHRESEVLRAMELLSEECAQEEDAFAVCVLPGQIAFFLPDLSETFNAA